MSFTAPTRPPLALGALCVLGALSACAAPLADPAAAAAAPATKLDAPAQAAASAPIPAPAPASLAAASAPAPATPAPPTTPAAAAPAAPAQPTAAAPASSPATAAAPAVASPPPPPAPASSAQDGLTSAALGDLGLKLLRQLPPATQGAENAVVSPVSLAYALGLVQAGTAGLTVTEINRLPGLGSVYAGRQFFHQQLPALLPRLLTPGGPLSMANRAWVDESLAPSLKPLYTDLLRQRYGADTGVLAFKHSDLARGTINRWVSEQTRRQIPELLPPGSLTSSSRLVLTNALHFKSAWERPFPATATQMRPFTLADGQVVQARTMQEERPVRQANVGGTTVLELPFAGQDYRLLLALPPQGTPLGRFTQALRGADLARWQAQLKPQNCVLSLPRFELAPTPRPLKAALKALGVRALFDSRANFSPMLGDAARGLKAEDVIQSAAIQIDESGGQASAATAVVIGLKSMAMPAPACAVNRPFVFALVHQPSGTPLFIGQLANPLRN